MTTNSSLRRKRTRCPLCGETHDGRSDLRIHLNVEHRKSEVADTLIATLEGGRPVDAEP